MAKRRVCTTNTVCGAPRGPAGWWFRFGRVDGKLQPVFVDIREPEQGEACCELCKAEIERRFRERPILERRDGDA